MGQTWPQQVWVKKTIHEEETHSSKEKVPGAAVSNEGDAEIVPGHERASHNWFSGKKV